MLIGENPLHIARLWQFLNNQLHRCGCGGINTLALATIDIALWDIVGQYHQEPLYKLLGGGKNSISVYGSGIDLFMTEDELLGHVNTFLEQGFNTIKIKIGREDPEEDLSRVTAVQRLIGPKRHLIVDANQKWTVSEALSRLNMLRQARLLWVEEPLHAEDVNGHADLRQMLRLPLAVGESLYTKHQFLRYLGLSAMDIVQADVCRVGGITEWIRIANLAAAYHRPIAPHYLAEISVAVLCGIDNGLILEWVRGGSFSEMGVLQNPIRMKRGVAFPFEEPGHGIKFDFNKLSPYEVNSEQLQRLAMRSAK
jgi:L-alanine-DL-glutamate epimerase-like enolase superfamily enzyme